MCLGRMKSDLASFGWVFQSHDLNVDQNSPFASQNTGKHGNALFSKCVWRRSAATPT